MKIFLPLYYIRSGGAGKFTNLLTEKLKEKDIFVTNDLNDKDIDLVLLNANSTRISFLIDFKFNNPKVPIVHRLDGLSSREERLESDLDIFDYSKFIDHIIYQSNHSQHSFSQIIKNKFYDIIYNGSDYKKTGKYSDGILLKIYHCSWATGPWKNNKLLFDYLDLLKNDKRVHFYTCGNYLTLEEIKEKNLNVYEDSPQFFEENYNIFKDYPNVTYLGYLKKISAPKILNRMDYLFFPSINDVCPNTVVEAICCGIPVIYHNSGGTPELVGDAGIALTNLTDLTDTLIMSKNRLKLLAEKRANLFDIEITTNKYLEVFNKNLKRKSMSMYPEIRIGWLMCYGSEGGSSRIGGFNIHNKLLELNIYSEILHENNIFSIDLLNISLKEIISKIKESKINVIILQKVCSEKVIELIKWCKENKVKVIYAIGDLVEKEIFYLVDLIITSSPYYITYLKENFGITNAVYIEDGIEEFKYIPKIHIEKEALTFGWFGNKDKFDKDVSFIQSIINSEDKLVTISNTPKANYTMGYGCENSWNLQKLIDILLEEVDIVLIPIDTSDEKSLFKSANRLTLAYSLAIPVISSKILSYEFATAKFNSKCLFANINNIEEWKNHISQLRDHSARKILGHLGRNFIIDRFNLKTITQEYIINIREILKE